MAAVVAVMAALAALGRDAFAALPDVKPITAMTLVVGYALGPLPGLHRRRARDAGLELHARPGPVHALADGGLGDGGARSGPRSGGSAGVASAALPLALACALSALGAKEVMNLYTWTLGASHTPAAFLAVAGQAVSYDVTDMVASFFFGFAFAPGAGAPARQDALAHGRQLGGGRARERLPAGARRHTGRTA